MSGKGSKRRPGDARKYAEGWARIFGKRKKRRRLTACAVCQQSYCACPL